MLILRQRWMYQKPSVLAVLVIACASPRYVFCRNENANLSFWQIDTSVPVVFRPCRHTPSTIATTTSAPGTGRSGRGRTHVGEEEERKEVDERVRQLLVLLERVPDLLPADRQVVLALWQRRAGAGLLEDDCGLSVSGRPCFMRAGVDTYTTIYRGGSSLGEKASDVASCE